MKKVTRPAPVPTRPPFEGDIDGLSGDEVRGWIVDTSDPGRYIYVCLFVNDRFIEKRWAAFFAKISDSCFGVEASMAFSLRVAHHLLREKELEVFRNFLRVKNYSIS
jgi:hypothetical protein